MKEKKGPRQVRFQVQVGAHLGLEWLVVSWRRHGQFLFGKAMAGSEWPECSVTGRWGPH